MLQIVLLLNVKIQEILLLYLYFISDHWAAFEKSVYSILQMTKHLYLIISF